VTAWYELLRSGQSHLKEPEPEQQDQTAYVHEQRKGYGKQAETITGSSPPDEIALSTAESSKSAQAEWTACIQGLSNEIKVRGVRSASGFC